MTTETRSTDIKKIIAENCEKIKDAWKIDPKFPKIRSILDADLLATFSHLNPNLAFDEIFSNYVLCNIVSELGFENDEEQSRVINAVYDNVIPKNDAPKGYTVQYGIVYPKVLAPNVLIPYQERFDYDPSVLYKDGQNRVKSAPEQNIEAFRNRFDQIDQVYQKHAGPGSVPDRIIRMRHDFFRLLHMEIIPEKPFSRRLAGMMADVLERLCHEGYPFWEMPIPDKEEQYKEHTFLVEGVDVRGRRQPASFDGKVFSFPYDEEDKRIPRDEIFDALRRIEAIPTMPLVILALATAPQLPHLGGAAWRNYAPLHVDAQSEWLGMPAQGDRLILSTGGHVLLSAYRRNEEFIGFPVVYMTYGAERIRKALKEGEKLRVEFKRTVY
ncbi:MAG: hypothetical protein ACE5JP_06480 [Candidatus Bipolaricaulia bacterium]